MEHLGLVCRRIAELAIARERLLIAVVGVLTLAAALAVTRVQITGDIVAQFMDDSPAADAYRRLNDELGSREVLVTAWEEQDPFDVTVLAAERRAVASLSRLGGVRQVASFATAIRAERATPVGLTIQTWEDALALANDSRRRVLIEEARAAVYLRDFIGRAADTAAIVIVLEDLRTFPPDAQLALLRDAEAEIRRAGLASGRTVHAAGLPAAAGHALALADRNLRHILPLVGLAGGLIVLLLLRRFWPALLVLLIGALAALLTVAACVPLGIEISIPLSAAPILILVLTLSSVVFLVHDVSRRRRNGEEPSEAVCATAATVGPACCLSSLAAAASLLTLALVPAPAIRNLGLVSALGIALALILELTLGVVLLRHLSARSLVPPSRLGLRVARLGVVLGARAPRAVISASVFAIAVLLLPLSRLELETDWARRFPPGDPLRLAQQFVSERLGGAATIDLVVRAKPREGLREPLVARVARLENELLQRLPIDAALSVTTTLRRIQAIRHPEEVEAFGESEDRVRQALFFLPVAGPEAVAGLVSKDASTLRVSLRVRTSGLLEVHRLAEQVKTIAEARLAGLAVVEVTGVFPMLGQWLARVHQILPAGLVLLVASMVLTLGLAYRSLGVGIWLLLPDSLSVISLPSLLAVTGQHFDSDYLVVAFLGFGVAVTGSIHLLSRYRTVRSAHVGNGKADIAAATRQACFDVAPAVAQTTTILVVALLPLQLTRYLSLAMWSDALAVILLVALAANLVLMPVLLQLGWLD